MRPRVSIFPVTVGLVLLAACTAGTGPATPIVGEAREPAAGGRQAPGSGRESPALSDGVGCLKCDYVYSCVATSTIETNSYSITLITKNGACVLKGNTSTVFRCDGIIEDGDTYGPIRWTQEADGAFHFQIPSAGNADVTCTPYGPYTAPSGGTSGGSGAPAADAG
jgi:hypothetical protein